MNLEGSVAVVTGSGSWAGAGRAAAIRLAQRGAVGVVINYSKSQAAAEDVARAVERLGARPLIIQADVSQPAQVALMIEKTVQTFGRLDILVNNAAWTARVRFDDLEGLTEEIWDRTWNVNVKGTFFCIRYAAPYLSQSPIGVVINTASIGGLRAVGSSSVAYAASKAAVMNMTQTLARALAPNIRVNAVAPGFIEGQWMQSSETGIGDRYETTKEKVAQKIPLKRIARPEDVADAVMALIDAEFVTGQTLVVDGGYTIRD
jgi:3-oxoacyl-[acyl-carrier protein] reductase